MKEHVKSSPALFRIVKWSFGLSASLLLILAAFTPAPLQEPARLSSVPNPVKSAWFLLWIQELVSHDIRLIYLPILASVLFTALPWIIEKGPDNARWFGREQRRIAVISLLAFLAIILLTVVALFFRGENWFLASPF